MSQVDKDAALNTSATAAPCSSLVFSEVSLGERHRMLKENCHKPNKDGIHPGSKVVWWVWYQCCFSISQPLATVVNVKKIYTISKTVYIRKLFDTEGVMTRRWAWIKMPKPVVHFLRTYNHTLARCKQKLLWLSSCVCMATFFYHSFLIYQWKNSNRCLS